MQDEIRSLAVELGKALNERIGELDPDVAVSPEEEHRRTRNVACDVLEQLERRAIGRVKVVEHDDERRLTLDEETRDRVEQAQSLVLRVERRRCRQSGQSLPECREDVCQNGS